MGLFGERFGAQTISQKGMGLISTANIFLGNILKLSRLSFSHLYKGDNKASFIVMKLNTHKSMHVHMHTRVQTHTHTHNFSVKCLVQFLAGS